MTNIGFHLKILLSCLKNVFPQPLYKMLDPRNGPYVLYHKDKPELYIQGTNDFIDTYKTRK